LGFCLVKGDELYQLYVKAESRGSGVATALMADAEARMSESGVKTAWLAKEVTPGGVTYEFASGTACFLYPTPNAGTSQASQAFWQVEDIEKEVAELTTRGVNFEKYDMPDIDEKGISTAGGAKAAWFKDTEGNIMALIQTL
jgi:hypothetical protein